MTVAASTAAAASLLAVDPVGLGGAVLRSAAGPDRDGWLARFAALLPAGTPWRRVPARIGADRLLGGLDLTATLQSGRPVAQRGLLAEADGGIVLLAMAERLDPATAAHVATVLDTGEVVVERDGLGVRRASRLAVIALDEGLDDERAPARLAERLAFHLTLVPVSRRDADLPVDGVSASDIGAARLRLPAVRLDDRIVAGLCEAAFALGVDSARAALFAVRAACASAALDGRETVDADDAALAAALVLAPRATRVPAREEARGDAEAGASDDEGAEAKPDVDADAPPVAPPAPERAAQPPPGADDGAAPAAHGSEDDPPPASRPDDDPQTDARGPDAAVQTDPAPALDERILEAALAALPPGLLALLSLGAAPRSGAAAPGTAGAARTGQRRGRPIGARRGELRGGARLALIETLRAAAPWQPLRRREAAAQGHADPGRLQVRREDVHVVRYRQRTETTTVFVVDASGSSALHRLAEAKGAVERLLADCYVRRDSVAVIAFRGAGAELLLPPTRSLPRAKRRLAGLPGGGGTPLAAGIASAQALAASVRRRGATPVVVLLTDGRANVARDGTPGRARAATDATAAAQAMRHDGVATLLLDTSPQPQPVARELAAALGARYLPLPHAGASELSQAVRLATAVRASA